MGELCGHGKPNENRCVSCGWCCDKHSDYCNRSYVDLERIREAWLTGDPDNVEDILIELFGDIPLK